MIYALVVPLLEVNASHVFKEIRLASILNIAVMGGILVAHILESFYGGSIISGNIAKTLLGLELAAFAALLAIVLAVVALILDKHLNRAV